MNKAGYISSDKKITDYINTDLYTQALDEMLKEAPNNQTYAKLKSDFKP
ncbi:MAG: hypothetical protein M1609_01435 [Firmicutes bacterium]|nr:hypothetical protein [Bacillota bacterium]